VDKDSWRLRIEGEVEQPLSLSLKEVQSLPSVTLAVTMECAGNGRKLMDPVPPGTPWACGAVSTVQFTGTPLYHLLDQAHVRPSAHETLFQGADQGEVAPGRVVPFARSLPLAVARHPHTLLAWAMNDQPLTAEHGFPLRLVVPGWYGMASVKWLARVSLLPGPFRGYFQQERYVYVQERGTPDNTPVTRMRVRAIMARPAQGARLKLGPVEVAGTAWSGEGPIARVEVSTDGGATWSQARLGRAYSEYAATPWSFLWTPPRPGTYTLVARATDAAGNLQPLESRWNTYGYGNNVVQWVRVTVG